MSAAATTSRSARTPKSPWSSHSQSRAPKATIVLPARTSASIGQGPPPTLTPSNHPGSPTQQNISARASSPSYFGLAVQDDIDNPINSDAGGYAKKNWRSPSSSRLSKAPEHVQSTSHETTPSLVAFQRQSETKVFQLDMGSSITSACSPRPTNPRSSSTFDDTSSLKSPKHITSDVAIEGSHQATAMELDVKSPLKRGLSSGVSEESQFGLPRRESPATLPTLSNLGTSRQLSHIDDRHPRLSLPNHRVSDSTTSQDVNFLGRSNTLPSELTGGQPNLLSPQDFVSLMDHVRGDNLLLLDLRVSPQFAQSRIHGALNLCIPTTLLKRPSFNVQKLLETFTVDAERRKFSGWKEMHYIVMYDANSAKLKDASSAVNTIKKFTSEGWKGVAYIVCGGYAEINKAFPNMVESAGTNSPNQQGQKPLALNGSGIIPVAGGFSMPAQKSVANPFFGNIRQNMDLIGGVGQIPIKHPDHLSHKSFKLLPMWLQRAAEEVDKGKAVSNNFLRIEKDEQERMQSALSTDVIYGTPGPALKSGFQVAGIEKGTKNRYKDILPFDHTRVKIRDLTTSSCDYINASHIKAEWSNRHYIATQAPMPSTFGDFWRVVWEQDVRVIVMLSAEAEGGQRKCHPYWLPDTYGAMKVKTISEKKIAIGSDLAHDLATPASFRSPLWTPQPERATPKRQRAVTQINPFAGQDISQEVADEVPFVVRRIMTLSHSSYPFQPMREITQLHYSHWPDFGAPAHATDLLAIVDQTNILVRKYNGISNATADLPAATEERPIVVHCSAGCGRTGTFCTIDSVIDMLKKQRQVSLKPKRIEEGDEMEIDEEPWVRSNENDLIAKAVNDFRHQRLSMVQTLRQYVLCYETVLEWLVQEMPEKFRRETLRRSLGA